MSGRDTVPARVGGRDAVLSIEEAAAMTPWSASTLYRVAKEPDSPFWKRAGRWATTESDLLAWVRGGEKPRREQASLDPMPRRSRSRGSTVLAEVHEIERRAA